MAEKLSDAARDLLIAAWPEMCAKLAAGELVRDIYAAAGTSPFMAAMFKAAYPAHRALWDQARQASADSFYDEAMAEARSDVDKEKAQHVRTRIDTLKWAARIRNPAMYSDKSSIDVNVKTLDLTKIISEANARLAAAKEPRLVNPIDNNSEALHDHARAGMAAIGVDPALLALL